MCASMGRLSGIISKDLSVVHKIRLEVGLDSLSDGHSEVEAGIGDLEC